MRVFDAYIDFRALRNAEEHAFLQSRRGLESIGFLLGDVFSWKKREYVFVREYVTGDNDATSVLVRFSEKAFPFLAKEVESKGLIVGWCHSHPGYGCFLSSQDIETHSRYFPESFHIALVLDPVRREKRVFKVSGKNYFEASYSVVERR